MIPHDRLVGLVFGELDDAEQRRVEDHVLGCSGCSAALERLLALRSAVSEAVRAGAVTMIITPGLLERMRREALVTRTYVIPPGGSVACSVGAGDIYTVVDLRGADLSRVSRLDVAIEATSRAYRIEDVPFDRARGVVLVAQRAATIRTLPSGAHTIRLLAVDEGRDREVGRYTMNHTAFTLPS
jgi:hypothetical protein